MGRISQNPSSLEPFTITHFSHLHPLQIFIPNDQPYDQTLASSSSSCYGCSYRLSPGDASIIYCCISCNFFLHGSCSKLPLQITHPVDQFHALSLLPTPIYPQGFFNCNACGKQGTGFSYHCGACTINLHPTCASTPLSLTHPTHHHQLTLTFSPPYPNSSFSCDICRNPGSNHWLYRCHHCHFDSHLSCATTANPRTLNSAQNYVGYPTVCVTQQRQLAAAQPQYVQMTVNYPVMNRQVVGSNGYARSNQLQGLFGLGNGSQSPLLTQTLMRGFLGGGGGGGGMSDPSGGGFDSGGGFGDGGSTGDFDF